MPCDWQEHVKFERLVSNGYKHVLGNKSGAKRLKIGQMEINKIYNEPCLETIKRMPDNFIDCVITSPPYWQLRDYGYSGQWGLEPTFQEYLEHLWSLMDAIYPKLKDGGTVWVNLGDTYSTQSGSMGSGRWVDPKNPDATNTSFRQSLSIDIKNKCLLLLPHRFAIGCIDMGWIVRNDVIWAKRNGMPESVTDRFCKKHEYFFFMVKSEKYYFELDAIREKCDTKDKLRDKSKEQSANAYLSPIGKGVRPEQNPNGKNPGSVSDFWDIPTKPSTEKHYASYNDSLLVKPILAGCPEGGIIYDPFMGTGSTAEAALRANRKYIGSEMSFEYVEICNHRLEPFLKQMNLF
jgi:DNA modification methylase